MSEDEDTIPGTYLCTVCEWFLIYPDELASGKCQSCMAGFCPACRYHEIDIEPCEFCIKQDVSHVA